MPRTKKQKSEQEDSKESQEESKKTNTKLSEQEFEKKVVELAGKGLTSEKIGETLRKQGIHSKEYNKKISRILKEKNLYVNPDLKNVENKLDKVTKHYEKNKQDKRAKREKNRIFSQLRKVKRYLKQI
jgi:ribosomal protein S15P/S13E